MSKMKVLYRLFREKRKHKPRMSGLSPPAESPILPARVRDSPTSAGPYILLGHLVGQQPCWLFLKSWRDGDSKASIRDLTGSGVPRTWRLRQGRVFDQSQHLPRWKTCRLERSKMKYVGWFLLILGTMAAFSEPHSSIGFVAVAGALLIAGDKVSAVLAQQPVS